MSRKTLFLMCGLAFSGKSTLAKAIVDHLGCAYVGLDDINYERGMGFGGQGIPIEEWEKSHQVALGRLDELMSRREGCIVLDDTNNLRWLRDRFRAVAGRHRWGTLVVYMDVPLDAIRGRMKENELSRRRAAVREEVFEALLSSFEIPEADEKVVTFSETDTVCAWVRNRLTKLLDSSTETEDL